MQTDEIDMLEEQLLRPLRATVLDKCHLDEERYRAIYARFFKVPLHGLCRPALGDRLILDENLTEEALCQTLFSFDETLSEAGRIQTGSYYTPTPLVSALWKTTLTQYFAQLNRGNKTHLKAFFDFEVRDEDLYDQLRPLLDALFIGDIASGTGQMLIGYMALIQGLDLFYTGLKRPLDVRHFYLADIRLHALELLLLVTLLWQEKGIITELPMLVHGDSLMAGGALDQLLAGQKLDVVIGNPPYLGEKNSKALFSEIKSTEWGSRYYEGKMDLFYFFIYKGLELIHPSGVLALITTRYFITADGATQLRGFLRENAKWLAFYTIAHKVFKSAQGQDNCFFALSKESDGTVEIGEIGKDFRGKILIDRLPEKLLYTPTGNLLIAESEAIYTMLTAYLSGFVQTLGQIFEVNQGIVSGFDRVKGDVGEAPVFVFTNEEIQTPSPYLRPFYKNSDIDGYFIKNTFQRQILYLTTKDLLTEEDWEWQHLLPYKAKLMARREFITGEKPWYALHWPRKPAIFQGPKLVVPQRGSRGTFAFHRGPFYASADVYYITDIAQDEKCLVSLMVYLNSAAVDYYLYHFGKRKGNDLELYATPLLNLPLPTDPHWIDILYPIGASILDKGACSEADQKRSDEAVYKTLGWDSQIVDEVENFSVSRRKQL